MLIIFDVLAIDGRAVHRRPYWERRRLLEDLALHGHYWSTTPSHTDGEALWEKVCELGLEGVVAKKRSGHYFPGRRGWIKTKNRAYWRYPLEASVPACSPRDHRSRSLAGECERRDDAWVSVDDWGGVQLELCEAGQFSEAA